MKTWNFHEKMKDIFRHLPTIFFFCILLPLPTNSSANVMVSGPYALEASLVSSAGQGLFSGQHEARVAVGDVSLAVSPQEGGLSSVLSGYLSSIRPGNLYGPVVEELRTLAPALEAGVPMGVPGASPVRVVFSNDMLAGTMHEDFFKVTSIRDCESQTVAINQDFTVTYNDLERSAVLTPNTSWTLGSLISVIVSSEVADTDSLTMAQAEEVRFEVIRDPKVRNLITSSFDPMLTVTALPNTFDRYFTVLISSNPQHPGIDKATEKLVLTLAKSPVRIIELRALDETGVELPGPFSQKFDLQLSFKDEDKDGVVDGTPFRSRTLELWRLQEGKSLWVRNSETQVDPLGHVASAKLQRFSIYSLVGGQDTDVSNVFAYPVPFRPNIGNPGLYGTWSTGITFTNLPSQGSIRIYNVAAERVREMPVGSAATLQWDVRNERGEKVGSGVYIWELRSGNNRKTGKMMVIR